MNVKIGDSEEAKAISRAYCENTGRKTPIFIGLSKSLMGHAEGASGIGSLIKMLIAYENECIPANLHLNQLKSEIKQLSPLMIAVRQNTKYIPGCLSLSQIKEIYYSLFTK